MNDSTVTVVSPQHVLKQQAYILFYSKTQISTPIISTEINKINGELNGNKNGNKTISVISAPSSSSGSKSNKNKIVNSSDSDSYIDDMGEILSAEELQIAHTAQLQLQQQQQQQKEANENSNKRNINSISSEVNHVLDKRGSEIGGGKGGGGNKDDDDDGIKIEKNNHENDHKNGIVNGSKNGIEVKNEKVGEEGEVEEVTNMRYEDIQTRLKKKYSWAVKPFRYSTHTQSLSSTFCYTNTHKHPL